VKQHSFASTAARLAAATGMSAALWSAAIAAQQDGTEQASVDTGKVTFAQKCSHCHGPNMVNSGTITPDLRRFPDDRPRFVSTVKNGKNGGRMPPWGDILSDDDIAALWAYVASRRAP
jgi:mono/diheme cytochrome c family protein